MRIPFNSRILTLSENQTQICRELIARARHRPAPTAEFLRQEYPWLEFLSVSMSGGIGIDGKDIDPLILLRFIVRNRHGLITEYPCWPYFRLTI